MAELKTEIKLTGEGFELLLKIIEEVKKLRKENGELREEIKLRRRRLRRFKVYGGY